MGAKDQRENAADFGGRRGTWARSGLSGLRRAVVDFLLPPLCHLCGQPVASPDALCAACWSGLHFMTDPCCHCCGLPFDVKPLPIDPEQPALCAACLAAPPAYKQARAALAYDDASKALILGFKHAGHLHHATLLTRLLATAGRDLIAPDMIVIPVPLHWRRRVQRRYNQAAILAQSLARKHGLDWRPHVLLRHRSTPVQGHLSPAARWRNVRGAFKIDPKHGALVKGCPVLLIDDVFTTGATLEACCPPLLKAGATSVNVLTIARVVGPRPIHTA